MKITPTTIPDVLLIEPTVFTDDRGSFFESYNEQCFSEAIGRNVKFVQDNESISRQFVLRGLHYQINKVQGKLVRVSEGEVFDVAVDIRRNSPTFGCWTAEKLSKKNKKQLWIPEGFAHGFLVLSDWARLHYKVTDYWYPEHERCILWNDATLGIVWPDTVATPIFSAKDAQGTDFDKAEVFA